MIFMTSKSGEADYELMAGGIGFVFAPPSVSGR